MRKRMIITAILAVLVLFMFTGCSSGNIREDSVQDGLLPIDPEAGVEKNISVTLYYRLTGEDYLVGVTRNVNIAANERAESAIIRTLLDGVPALSNNVSALFPEGTSIVDITLNGGILYVTLSNEFLDTYQIDSDTAAAISFVDSIAEESSLTEQEKSDMIKDIVDQAQKTLDTQRSLGIYSLVNTIAGYSGDMRVQFLVDINNDGTGSRLSCGELGLELADNADSDLIEPLEFNSEVIVTPQIIVNSMFNRMMNGEYERAYAFLAESESDGGQKPSYASFETEMLGMGSIAGYTLYNYELDDDDLTARVRADITMNLADGSQKTYEDLTITLKREGDLFKVGYAAFKRLMEG